MIEFVLFCGMFGCAIGATIIAPAVVRQRLEDDIIAGEFDSRDQWHTSHAALHRESQQTRNSKSGLVAWRLAPLDHAENQAAASIASSGTHMSNVRLSTRLLRLLGSLLLPQSKRFRVSWCGDIFWHNVKGHATAPTQRGSMKGKEGDK